MFNQRHNDVIKKLLNSFKYIKYSISPPWSKAQGNMLSEVTIYDNFFMFFSTLECCRSYKNNIHWKLINTCQI